MLYLDVEGSNVVPGISIVWLLLGTPCERLDCSPAVPGLQVAVAQREPALRVQRVDGQRYLPVLCCLKPFRGTSAFVLTLHPASFPGLRML